MKMRIGWIAVLALLLCLPSPVRGEEDAEGAKDHPMFTRMPGFFIREYEEKEFDQVDFVNAKGEEVPVEGKVTWINYWIAEGKKAPSEIQILRNHANAIRKIGGSVVRETRSEVYLSLSQKGKTFWAIVDTHNDGETYELTVVEKAEMAQDVVADAKSLADDIRRTGHASVYGIYFDFNKSTLKPESERAIREIAQLLSSTPKLSLYVVGHTDGVGEFAYNRKLSQERAERVVEELVKKHRIAAKRLSAHGVGPLAPVETNRTEEGRAKNRRVELVER